MINLDTLRLQAVKTGLGMKYLAKEEKISLLLIQLHEIFSDTVVLKGGTAVNRVYLQPQHRGRFSEDIDLDYRPSSTLPQKINHIKTSMKKINDFDVSPPRMLHSTIRFDCHYVNQLDEKDRVQVEFYLSEHKSAVHPQQTLVQSQYLLISATLFSVYALEDLIAQKLIALYRRGEGKDIYDVFYTLDLPTNHKIIQQALNHLFTHYHIELGYTEFIKAVEEKLIVLQKNARYIGNTTNHFIPKNLRPEWTVFIRMLQEKIKQNLQ